MSERELFEPILTTDALLAATDGAAWVDAMLAFEAELALAEAEAGLVPAEAARAIAAAAASLRPSTGELGRAARASGNPVVPLVRALGAAAGPDAAAFVHYGATSQDALDTAAMLVARRAGTLVLESLDAAEQACAALAAAHGDTLLAGRTLLQQALPVPFALKAAGWLVGLVEAGERLDEVVAGRLALQLGGAAGTLAALGSAGPAVAARVAGRLALAEAPLAWHTDRTRVAELAGALALVAGACAKVALDVALLSQTEVGEAREPAGPGRGGSSTLPHKRNPIGSVLALAAARRAEALSSVLHAAMVQEHERAAGAWHAEWSSLSELLRAAGGAAGNVAEVLAGLEVDRPAMAANLARLGGVLLAERVVFDLAPELGRERASALVEDACREALRRGAPLAEVLARDAEVAPLRSPAALAVLCDPAGYLGASEVLVARALERYAASPRRRREKPGGLGEGER